MIEFRDVHKSFNDDIILDGATFQIGSGDTKIILGVSGSGKSTILKLILGLIRPDKGRILVEGEDITRLKEGEMVEIRQRIGMVFQEGALFDSLTVRENVGYRLYEEAKLGEKEIDTTVRKLLGFVGLEDAIDKMPSELSGGMKRRVGLARALVGSPKIILYDEPTAGLDPITKRTIVELMIKLRDLEGVTSVFVTHDLRAAGIIACEYAVAEKDGTVSIRRGGRDLPLSNIHFMMLQEGRISFEGSFQQMMESNDPYVKSFLI